MPAFPYDILVEPGSVWTQLFEWHDGDEDGPLIPFDPAYRAVMQIRPQPTSAEVLATLTSDDGAIELNADGVDGHLRITIGSDVTALITRDGGYDLELHDPADPAGTVRWLKGQVLRDREFTR